MSNMNNNTPGWVAYLTGAVLIVGIGYAAYAVGFRQQTHQGMINQELGLTTIQPKMELIPQRTAQAIANGDATYQRVCSPCHKPDLSGVVGPNLKDAEWLHGNGKETDVYKIIANGIPASAAKSGKGPMPAKGGQSLSGEQVWEVIYFIGTKNPTLVKDAVPNMK